MNKKLIQLFAVLMLTAAACSRDDSVAKIRGFVNNTWERFDFVTFSFNIEEEASAHNIYLLLRYNDDFPSEALVINLVMTLPSGEERIRDYAITLKEKDGSLSGVEKAGYHEKVFTVREGMRIPEAGTLNFEIENLMTKFFTPGIVEIGIILEPSQQ
jgi:gliding motility-associated lipoprotein GldH